MDTMSALASALMGDAKTSATPSDAAIGGRSAPPGVTKVKCEKTGYVLTKPFEANNPMRGGVRSNVRLHRRHAESGDQAEG